MSLISNNPVYYLEKILSQIATGEGGAILSVTGDLVDNTDPINPVVNLSTEDRAKLDSLSKAYIIMQSTTTQAISTDSANPTVLDNWVVLASNGFSLQGDSIRNDTGRTIALAHGTLGLHPQVDGSGGNRELLLGSEYSDDDGVTYTPINQLRPIFTQNNRESFETKESYTVGFLDNRMVRFAAYASDSLSIATSSAPFRATTITGPAMVWILIEA